MTLIDNEALTPEERTTKVTFYHKACNLHKFRHVQNLSEQVNNSFLMASSDLGQSTPRMFRLPRMHCCSMRV